MGWQCCCFHGSSIGIRDYFDQYEHHSDLWPLEPSRYWSVFKTNRGADVSSSTPSDQSEGNRLINPNKYRKERLYFDFSSFWLWITKPLCVEATKERCEKEFPLNFCLFSVFTCRIHTFSIASEQRRLSFIPVCRLNDPLYWLFKWMDAMRALKEWSQNSWLPSGGRLQRAHKSLPTRGNRWHMGQTKNLKYTSNFYFPKSSVILVVMSLVLIRYLMCHHLQYENIKLSDIILFRKASRGFDPATLHSQIHLDHHE